MLFFGMDAAKAYIFFLLSPCLVRGNPLTKAGYVLADVGNYSSRPEECLLFPNIESSSTHKLLTDLLNTENVTTAWLNVRKRDFGALTWLSGEKYDAGLKEHVDQNKECAILMAKSKKIEEEFCDTPATNYICEGEGCSGSDLETCIHHAGRAFIIYAQDNNQEELTWYEARDACQTKNQQLASLNETIRNVLLQIISYRMPTRATVWIGLRRKEYYIDLGKGETRNIKKHRWGAREMCPCDDTSCVIAQRQSSGGKEYKWKKEDCSAEHHHVCWGRPGAEATTQNTVSSTLPRDHTKEDPSLHQGKGKWSTNVVPQDTSTESSNTTAVPVPVAASSVWVIGLVVAVLVLAIIVLVVILYFCWWKNRKKAFQQTAIRMKVNGELNQTDHPGSGDKGSKEKEGKPEEKVALLTNRGDINIIVNKTASFVQNHEYKENGDKKRNESSDTPDSTDGEEYINATGQHGKTDQKPPAEHALVHNQAAGTGHRHSPCSQPKTVDLPDTSQTPERSQTPVLSRANAPGHLEGNRLFNEHNNGARGGNDNKIGTVDGKVSESNSGTESTKGQETKRLNSNVPVNENEPFLENKAPTISNSSSANDRIDNAYMKKSDQEPTQRVPVIMEPNKVTNEDMVDGSLETESKTNGDISTSPSLLSPTTIVNDWMENNDEYYPPSELDSTLSPGRNENSNLVSSKAIAGSRVSLNTRFNRQMKKIDITKEPRFTEKEEQSFREMLQGKRPISAQCLKWLIWHLACQLVKQGKDKSEGKRHGPENFVQNGILLSRDQIASITVPPDDPLYVVQAVQMWRDGRWVDTWKDLQNIIKNQRKVYLDRWRVEVTKNILETTPKGENVRYSMQTMKDPDEIAYKPS